MGAESHLQGIYSIAPERVGSKHTSRAGRGKEQDRPGTAVLLLAFDNKEDIAAV